jgi:glycosyltransferase involved in cell wall biosynthesis
MQPSPLALTLLRDIPSEKRMSMERFASGLHNAFVSDTSLVVTSVAGGDQAADAARGRLRRYKSRYWSYPRMVRGLSADVFHVVDHGYADLVRQLPAARTVVTCHDLMLLRAAEGVAGFRGPRLTTLRFRWSIQFLRRVGRVVCDSEATRQDLLRLCRVDPERTSVVPLGVEPWFKPALDAPTRSAPMMCAQHILLHVTTGNPYKNVPATIRLLRALRDEGLDAALVRVGPPLAGPDRRVATELGVMPYIVEEGRVTEARLVDLYNIADVFVFPSHWEGFGWPPLEAMACGTPVVTSNRASLPEVVGDAGLTVPPTDVGAMVAAVGEILTSSDTRERLRAAGLARAAEYTWARTAACYREAYDSVADG